jgi:hypothetical protein
MTKNICSNKPTTNYRLILEYIFESRRCIGKNATKYWIEILLPPAKNQNPLLTKQHLVHRVITSYRLAQTFFNIHRKGEVCKLPHTGSQRGFNRK